MPDVDQGTWLGNAASGAGSALMSMLGAAGYALDTPRRLGYQGLSALTGHDYEGFGDVLAQVGVPKDSLGGMVGGFLGDVATDPLTWAGIGAGRYLRGIRATQELGKASSMGEHLSPLRDALRGTAVMDRVEPVSSISSRLVRLPEGGIGATVGNPEGEAIRGRVRRIGSSEVQGLREDVRRGFTSGTVAPKGAEQEFLDRFQRLRKYGTDYANAGLSMDGMYDPVHDVTVLAQGTGPITARHERVHAAIQQSLNNPELQERLPPLMEAASRLREAPYGSVRSGLGLVTDELAAQTLERRDTAGQVRSALHFLFNPQYNKAYSQIYSQNEGIPPLVRRAYSALPYAPEKAGTAASALVQLMRAAGPRPTFPVPTFPEAGDEP